MGLCLPVQGVWVQFLVRELGSHMPQDQGTTALIGSNLIAKSINTLKMVHTHKNLRLKQVAEYLMR